MIFQKKFLFHLLMLTLFLFTSSSSFSDESCPKVSIPNDRSIQLTIHRSSSDHKSIWRIQGAFVVDKDLKNTFEAAKKIERLEQVIPLINIFNLSEDRKKLQCGLQLLPGIRFQQTFQIEVVDISQKFNVQFVEGSFTGLSGQVCFSSNDKKRTDVIVAATGTLDHDPVPFFITNSMLERLSKSVLRRWRNDIESKN